MRAPTQLIDKAIDNMNAYIIVATSGETSTNKLSDSQRNVVTVYVKSSMGYTGSKWNGRIGDSSLSKQSGIMP